MPAIRAEIAPRSREAREEMIINHLRGLRAWVVH
jgi:hypothetical protein